MRLSANRLICFLTAHRMVARAEEFGGQIYDVEKVCTRCGKASPMWPGSLVKALHEEYESLETDWKEIYPCPREA